MRLGVRASITFLILSAYIRYGLSEGMPSTKGEFEYPWILFDRHLTYVEFCSGLQRDADVSELLYMIAYCLI